VSFVEKFMREFWPYIVPLPIAEGRQSEVLHSLFKSKASIEIVRSVPLEGVIYQKDMIENLPYSNKTILKRLSSLVSNNVLSEGMEKSDKRRAWVKWYKLSNLGRWIKLLMMPPQNLPKATLKKIVGELLKLYIEGAVKLCFEHKINPEIIKDTFEKAYCKAISKNPTAT
jgi:hypothetical protein